MKSEANTSDPPAVPRKILIVDDFEDNRAMYAEYLRYSGFDVVEASNGAEAIALAIATKPDAVIMDLSLPVLDGWEATRRLKADARTCHIPVVALTGHALEGHSQGAREAGCDCFLAKPCLPETLLSAVKELLARDPESPRGSARTKATRRADSGP